MILDIRMEENLGIDLVVTCFNDLSAVDILAADIDVYQKNFHNIIIVDDHSSDGTFEKVVKIFSGLERVYIHRCDENSGRPSIPRNIGVNNARSSHIMFLDIGDRIPEAYIRFVKKAMQKNMNTIYSGYKLVTNSPQKYSNKFPKASYKSVNILKCLMTHKMIALLSGLTVRRSIASKHLFEHEFHEDWHFVLKCQFECEFSLINAPIIYKKDGKNLSPKKLQQAQRYYARERSASKIVAYVTASIIKFGFERQQKLLQTTWMKERKQ